MNTYTPIHTLTHKLMNYRPNLRYIQISDPLYQIRLVATVRTRCSLPPLPIMFDKYIRTTSESLVCFDQQFNLCGMLDPV